MNSCFLLAAFAITQLQGSSRAPSPWRAAGWFGLIRVRLYTLIRWYLSLACKKCSAVWCHALWNGSRTWGTEWDKAFGPVLLCASVQTSPCQAAVPPCAAVCSSQAHTLELAPGKMGTTVAEKPCKFPCTSFVFLAARIGPHGHGSERLGPCCCCCGSEGEDRTAGHPSAIPSLLQECCP